MPAALQAFEELADSRDQPVPVVDDAVHVDHVAGRHGALLENNVTDR
jgi:hypothetical protein